MTKLLVVCGPTATGKTALGIKIANDFNGEIISADSRQVYKGIDIGSGKKTKNLKAGISGTEVYYEAKKKTKIWGYDLATPTQDFSVSHFEAFARKKIDEISSQGKLPILVGGTGLYIRAVIDGIGTVSIPQNMELRDILKEKSSKELFGELLKVDATKALSLNESDRANPRRLIRAIEIATSGLTYPIQAPSYNTFIIGLTAPLEALQKRVEVSIEERVREGVFEEVDYLLKNGVTWSDKSMSTLGVRQLKEYFEKKVTRDVVIQNWVLEEKKYVKRQLTWFKKDRRINWVDITSPGFQFLVEELVKKWHNSRKN